MILRKAASPLWQDVQYISVRGMASRREEKARGWSPGVTTETLEEEGACICRFFVAQVKRIEKEQFFCPTFGFYQLVLVKRELDMLDGLRQSLLGDCDDVVLVDNPVSRYEG